MIRHLRRACIVIARLSLGALSVVVLSALVVTPASAASNNLRFLDFFRLVNANTPPTECLAIPAHSSANGTGAIQWPCESSSDQGWAIYVDESYPIPVVYDRDGNPVPEPTVELVNISSNKCLADPAGSPNPVQLIQWTCNNGNEQRWQMLANHPDISTGFWQFKNIKSHLSMAVSQASHMNGAHVIQWPFEDNDEQVWSLASTS